MKKDLKIAILTTDTDHHTFFINSILAKFKNIFVVFETKRLIKPYVLGPFFEDEEQSFNKNFFKSVPEVLLVKKDRIKTVKDINSGEALEFIKDVRPDICVCFGTGIIKRAVYQIPYFGTINVHRGIIQDYRGLDSDLWAVLRDDFNKLGTTIHYVNDGIDTGSVIAQKRYKIQSNDEIFHLKYHTTLSGTKMVISALQYIERNNSCPISVDQVELGQYYTAMSLTDKVIAHTKFQKYKISINHD